MTPIDVQHFRIGLEWFRSQIHPDYQAQATQAFEDCESDDPSEQMQALWMALPREEQRRLNEMGKEHVAALRRLKAQIDGERE